MIVHTEAKTEPIAVQLARWTAALTFDDLAVEVIALAKQCVLDALANVILGASRTRTQPYLELIDTAPANGVASIAMRKEKVSVRDAAFINAINAQSCELDDVSDGAGGHPGAVTVPMAIALAERDGYSGKDVITGVVAGYEIMYRSINPIFPSSDRRGVNGTGVSGPFGSAAVIGNMTGVPADVLANAFGIAGAYSGGLLEYDQTGGEIKRVYPGLGSRGGFEAVALAKAGITGPLTVLEGDRGLFHAFGNDIALEKALSGLGTDFRIFDRRAKLYPVVGTIQGSIEAIARLCEAGIDPADVERIVVTVPHVAVKHGGAVQVPTDMATSQFSFAYSMALRVLYGSNDLDLYEDPTVRSRAEVVAMCQRVTVEEDLTLAKDAPVGGATVTVQLRDGRAVTDTQRPPTGAPGKPMTWDEAADKFRRLTAAWMSPDDQAELIAIIHHLESESSMNRLATLLRSTGAQK